MSPAAPLLFLALGASAAGEVPQARWKLAFEDRFERKELGKDWIVRQGAAEIRGGRLFISGAGATVLVDRPFASDVRLEFTAEANPDLPPCDISAALGSSGFWGWEYLLAFGGRNDQVNQILGGSAGKVDDRPPFPIEHGKRYRITATKEGRRLSLAIDGVEVLSSEDDDPVGGPGFDRVGLVTWGGMYVDRVEVHERSEPAPGGPVVLVGLADAGWRWERRRLRFEGPEAGALKGGLEAYNAGRFREAFDLLASVSPPTLASVAGLAYVTGDLAFEDRPGDREKLAALAAEVARGSPQDRGARDLARAAEWFRRITIQSRDRRGVTRLTAIGPRANPFYYKAELFRARYHHAGALEGADSRRREEALGLFRSLLAIWPEHRGLRELTGERVPWGPELVRPESSGPAWARHLEECFARQLAILEWWFTVRQAPDGQLGGGWGDDVEILRSWVPVAAISTGGETAVSGIEKMAEGVWKDVLRDGYVPEVGDVEHNAEPPGDALPGMILLRYGDPRFVEENLRTARTIREKFLARNRRGRLQFRSAEFGTGGVNEHPRVAADTGYHARAMRPILWLAWYGIPEAREVFLDWCETWREATVSRIGTKVPGFAPASIFFPSGEIDPPTGKPWHDPGSHYYGFPGLPLMVHESLLSGAWLSGERRFLVPVEAMLDLAAAGPLANPDPSLAPDHPRNLLAALSHQAGRNVLAVHRWLTGQRVHDGFLKARGSAPQRYLASGDVEEYGKSFERIAADLRHGFAARTSEVLQTDRAGLPGAEEVFCAYTGAVRDLRDTGTPTFAVTWDAPPRGFAALVTEASPSRLRVQLYSFLEESVRLGLRPWRLLPGRYALLAGEALPSELPGATRSRWLPVVEVEHRHRGSPIPLDLPPGMTWVIDLRLEEALPSPALLPDLAIAARDVRREGSTFRVTVHNIGGADAGPFSIALQSATGSEWVEVARAEVEGLPAIRDLAPSIREVEIRPAGALPPGRLRIEVDPDGKMEEICEMNDAAEIAP